MKVVPWGRRDLPLKEEESSDRLQESTLVCEVLLLDVAVKTEH